MADVRGFLEAVGIEVVKERGGELECRCTCDGEASQEGHLYVHHGADKPGVFNCKRANCSLSAGGNAYQLALHRGWVEAEAMALCQQHGLTNGRACMNGARPAPRGRLTIAELARGKGVSIDALKRLGAIEIDPFTSADGRWVGGGVGFPMRDGGGETIIGWRVRTVDGKGFTLPPNYETTLKTTGGRLGLIIPTGIDKTKPIVNCEGETTCAAALDAGMNAVATPGANFRTGWASWFSGADVELVPDADKGGHEGAVKAHRALITVATSVQIVKLPYAVEPKGGKDLRDYLQDGGSAAAYQKLPHAGIELIEKTGTDLPVIPLDDRPLRDRSADALDALVKSNDPPVLLRHGGGLARVVRDENGRAVVDPVGESELRGRLTRVADFCGRAGRGGRQAHKTPPRDTVLDILGLGEWPFPPLTGVTEAPVVRADGSILSAPGYDPATGLHYAPDAALDCLTIPLSPATADIRAALALLHEAIQDFPFGDDASMANTLGMMLTPIVRPALPGHVPAAVVDAPKQGSGKTLLAELTSIIATGRPGAMMGAPANDKDGEWDKRITALLRAGATMVVIDNIEGVVRAPSLCRALTCSIWQSRVLGLSQMVNVPQRATWIVTGNNISLAGDLPRRCYWIRLDPKTARPEKRTGFRHPDLLDWASGLRRELVAALLTLVRGWHVAGRPIPEGLPTLGSFQEWVNTIGGVLELAGVKGFLSNQDAFRDCQNEEDAEWESFLWQWRRVYGDSGVLVKQLVDDLDVDVALVAALPGDLADARIDKPQGFRKKLGWALKKHDGTRYGVRNIRMTKAPEPDTSGVAVWCVVVDDAPDPAHEEAV